MSQIWKRSAEPEDVLYISALYKLVYGETAPAEYRSNLLTGLEHQLILPKDKRFIFIAGICGLYAAYAQIESGGTSRQLQELVVNPRYPELGAEILIFAGIETQAPVVGPKPETTAI